MAQKTFDVETIIPLNFYSSRHYIPFWLLTLSKFLLFLPHNMISALATTLLGKSGSIALAILYIFFILGNFLAPPLMDLSNNNSGKLMFFTSILFTLFAAATTIVIIGMHSDTELALSFDIVHNCFYIASAIVGLAGGAIWVGYGVMNIEMGENISAIIYSEHPGGLPPDSSFTEAELKTALTDAITAKIMSIGWSFLALNTVIGGIITFIVLAPGSDHGDATHLNPGKLKFLFILFTIISCFANISYFALWKYPERNKAEDIPQISEQVTDSTTNLPEYYPVYESEEPVTSEEPATPEEDLNGGEDLNTDQEPPQPTVSQWTLFIELMQTSYILLSLTQYVAAGMSFNFLFSSFSAYVVSPVLGAENVALVVIIAYSTSTITSFCMGSLVTTHILARRWSIFGTIIQLVPPIVSLMIELDSTTHSGYIMAWVAVVVVCIAAGGGDAAMNSSLSTVMSADIKKDRSLCGGTYANRNEKTVSDIKSIVYSIYSSVKSVGVFLVFFLSGITTYFQQCAITAALTICSIIAQYFLYDRLVKSAHSNAIGVNIDDIVSHHVNMVSNSEDNQ